MKLLLSSLALVTIVECGTSLANEQWSQFRGPEGNGHINSTSLPLEWGENKNISWKTAIHNRGWSSPVIWNNQIWMTTATKDGKKMFAICVDKKTGKILHDSMKDLFWAKILHDSAQDSFWGKTLMIG